MVYLLFLKYKICILSYPYNHCGTHLLLYLLLKAFCWVAVTVFELQVSFCLVNWSKLQQLSCKHNFHLYFCLELFSLCFRPTPLV